MPDIYGSHFEYANTSSRTYGLIFANVETSRFSATSGSVSSVTVFNKSNKRRYLVDTDYSGYPIDIDIEIITDDERCLSLSERRQIERWLFTSPNYRQLYLDIDDDCEGETYETVDGVQKRLYLNCRFINPTKLEYNGGIIGYQATLETDSGMWWQDAITVTGAPAQGASSFYLNVDTDTDIEDYIYPTVEINAGLSGGDITIINYSDDIERLTTLVDVPGNSRLKLIGELNMLSGYSYDFLYRQNFPRLINGANRIYVGGDVSSITYTFHNRRRF